MSSKALQTDFCGEVLGVETLWVQRRPIYKFRPLTKGDGSNKLRYIKNAHDQLIIMIYCDRFISYF